MGIEANYYEKVRNFFDSFFWLSVHDFCGNWQDADVD